MRLRFSRLIAASLSLCCATFIYLSLTRYTRPSLIPLFGAPASSEFLAQESQHVFVSNAPLVEEVRKFWAPFARDILAAKPRIAPIELIAPHANRAAPKTITSSRKPPYEHVALSKGDLESLKSTDAQFRASLDRAFENGPDDAMAQAIFAGEGIVTVAGGEYFGPAIIGIKMLRQTGCTLPVEAFLANHEEYEPELCEEVLPNLNARCLVLTDFLDADDGLKVSHYQLKSLAILFSSFQHTLYLDSDSIPLINPAEELFAREPYISTGLVSWPDFWVGSESPSFYVIVGLKDYPSNLPASSTEAGQLVIDKGRHLKTLLLATYYNIWGPHWYYPLQSQGALGQGDKNTFETAAIVLNQPWYRVKTQVMALGRQAGTEYKGSGMVQFHPGDDLAKFGFESVPPSSSYSSDGPKNQTVIQSVRPAFMHANTPKMNAGHLVDEGDLEEPAGQHLRLWGKIEEQEALFGEDLERRTWALLVDSGCQLAHVLREWKKREDVCGRLKAHWSSVFE
jgi:alpha 1,2-mannosyltransferase